MWRRVVEGIDCGVESLLSIIFAIAVVIALVQVFCRYALNVSLSWSEEAQIFGHIWIVFLGIPVAYRRGAHMYIETYVDKLPPGPRSVFNFVVELLWAAFAVSLMILGAMVARVAHLQESPGLEVPMSYPYAGMVLGGVYLLFVALRRLTGKAWQAVAA